MTVAQLWAACMAREAAAARWLAHLSGRLVPVLAFFGHRPVGNLTALDVASFRAWRHGEGAGRDDIDAEAAALVTLLRWAVAADAFGGQRRPIAAATLIAACIRVPPIGRRLETLRDPAQRN